MNTLSQQIDILQLENEFLKRQLELEKKNSRINLRMYNLQMDYYHKLYNLMQEYIIGAVTEDDIYDRVDSLDNELETLMLRVIKEGEL